MTTKISALEENQNHKNTIEETIPLTVHYRPLKVVYYHQLDPGSLKYPRTPSKDGSAFLQHYFYYGQQKEKIWNLEQGI